MVGELWLIGRGLSGIEWQAEDMELWAAVEGAMRDEESAAGTW